MITAAGTPEGVEDVWMTGFLDGQCPPDEHECGRYGKVSYLGGHRYSVDVPVSANPDAQGTRMFLNSLFEAPCATVEGLPNLAVAVGAPAQTIEPEVTFQITYVNTSFATALDVVLIDTLPGGATFVSASGGGTVSGSEVTWNLGNLGPGESGDVEIDVQLEAFGVYPNSARLDFDVGLTPLSQESNVSQTEYADEFPAGTGSSSDSESSAAEADADTGGDSTSTSGGSSEGAVSTSDNEGSSSGGAPQGEQVEGCDCRQTGPARGAWLIGLALLGLTWRRRRAAAIVCATIGTGCANESPAQTDETGGLGMTAGTTATDDADPATGPIKLDANPPVDMFVPEPEVGCQAIDFLFVIDSSESMKDHQSNLVNSFPGFAAEIESAVPSDDWHVMVVDTDAQWGGAECANACTTLGTCPDEPAFACTTPSPGLCDITIGAGESAPFGEGASNQTCLDGDARFLAEGNADLESIFSCMARVGVDGNSEERTAEALVRAISPEMLDDDACNEGFLRDEAILVVTIITDEPDAISPDAPEDWTDALLEAKNQDPGGIVILGLIPDGGDVCEDPANAPRLSALLDALPSSSWASVCETDYSPFFADAVEVILDTCEEFEPPPPQP